MQIKNKNKGITLITLVITIIVLLILAGVSIEMLIGPNGLLTKATEASLETKKAEVKEKVELEILKSYDEKTGNMDKEKLKKNLVENLGVNEIDIQEDEEGNLNFPYEGFTVKIDKDWNVEIIEDGEEEPSPLPPDLQESDIGISYDTTEWTQGPVKVTLTKNIQTKYKLQYSTSRDSTWIEYTEPFEVTENNTEIYARLVDDSNQPGGQYTTGNVQNIDRLGPSRVEFTNDEPTTSSVIIRASADDAEATDEDGCSGIVKYYYSINGPGKNETTGGLTETFYEFTGLKQGETYTVQVEAEDDAKNKNPSSTKEITIGKVTDLKENDIKISYSTTEWTPGPVEVTLTKNIQTNYKLQYSTSRDATWIEYTDSFEVTENNTEIYARLVDDSNQPGGQYTTGNVQNIDRLGPSRVEVTNDEPVLDYQTSLYNVVVRASADDAEATDKDGCSGIVKYYYTINGPDKNETTEGTSETSYQFKGLQQGETYQVTVTAEDEAKNSNTSEATEITTELSYEPIEGHELEIKISPMDEQHARYETGDHVMLNVTFKNIGTKKLTNLTATIHSKWFDLYKTKVDIPVSELEVNESSNFAFDYTFILDDMGGTANLIFSMCYTEDGTDWPVKKVESSCTFNTYERFRINTFYTLFARCVR